VAFSKEKSGPEVSFELRHPWHPGSVFVFTFPKELPQAALDKAKHFLGLTDDERKDAVRVALIAAVGAMVSSAPEGFEGFPADERPLADRFTEYFDDPAHPELESLVAGAWRAYRAACLPAAYLKSREGSGAAGRVPAPGAGRASSAV
jgi:hypothetical protein